ncbi:hypothetical protein [Halogeometricum sp. CBA1124]|uniref:hypothetical protein n=1 Tax=Halogeometricum sp. CBA1124 TaxID=2668071 RepID=UPI001E37BB95|nr:hypothetical protein [Halogeometricum sp. CBA1124]
MGALTIVAGLVGYLGKQAIRQYFDKELQAFQSELNKESIRFSGLHEMRGEVISTFYARLTEFDEDMRSLVDPAGIRSDASSEEKIKQAAESGETFRQYYKEHKIYFPPEVCETMESLLNEYRDMFHDFSVRKIHDPSAPNSGSEDIKEWQENWKSLTEEEIPEMRADLENHFRDLLGVDYDTEAE